MFAIDCPTHGRPVLVPANRIRALENTPTGILVVVECWCDTRVRLRLGRHARPATQLVPAA